MATFAAVMAPGLPGQIAYPGGWNGTCAAEVAIPFGRFVTRGTAEGQGKLPTSSAEVTGTGLGFAVRVPILQNTSSNGDGYLIKDAVTYLKDGWIWVYAEGTVAAGGAVFVRFTTAGGGADLGRVRADADTDKAVALPAARFEEGRTGAGLVRISCKVGS